MNVTRIVVVIAVVLLVAAVTTVVVIEVKKKENEKKKPKMVTQSCGTASSSAYYNAPGQPDQGQYGSQYERLDQLQGGRRRSMKATGYSSDQSQACYNENLVGSIQAPYDAKVGSSRCSFPSMPIGSKPVPLGSTRLSGKRMGKGYGGTGQTSRVDLSEYAQMGTDRAMGMQGLDLPEDLALASMQLGHLEISEPTRTDSTHPWGETPSSWNVGYSVNTSGNLEPGNGIIPTIGPAALAARARGVSY